MSRKGISECLHAVGKFENKGECLPHESSNRQGKNRTTNSKILFFQNEIINYQI